VQLCLPLQPFQSVARIAIGVKGRQPNIYKDLKRLDLRDVQTIVLLFTFCNLLQTELWEV
jgi:hypothetical protein